MTGPAGRLVLCHQHGPVWLARCLECRAARAETLLCTVQSCTVRTPAHVSGLRKHAPGAVGRHPVARVARGAA